MDCNCPKCGVHGVRTGEGILRCPSCGHVVAYPARLDDLKRKYPHAANNITAEGLLNADEQTLGTWEFEGELCDAVEAAVGSWSCPKCLGKVWKVGDTIVNFYFPFHHSMRVQVAGDRTSRSVKCVVCGLRRRLKS